MPPEPFPREPGTSRTLAWALAAVALLAILAAFAFGELRHRPDPPVVYLGARAAVQGADAQAVAQLVQWQLEAAGFSVLTERSEAGPLPAGLRGGTLVLQLRAAREEGRLRLQWRTARVSELARLGEAAWKDSEAAGIPRNVLGDLYRQLPCPLGAAAAQAMLPLKEENFWRLVGAVQDSGDYGRIGAALDRISQLLQEEPDCTAGLFLRGDLLYRKLLVDPRSDASLRPEAEACFLRALELSPGLPQAVFLLVQLKTDAGDQRSALTALQYSIRLHPRGNTLLTGLGYAARTAGLLSLAQRALEQREELGPPELVGSGVENTWLYLGEWDRFEASLIYEPNHPWGSVVAFYKGYLDLAKGRRGEAAVWFRRCREGAIFGQFNRLGEVFELICLDRPDEARARLRTLAADRVSLHVPDGEFTFKLAEAFALLGDRNEALEMASKAFSQGFGCTRWYEQSPFLRGLQDSPRWQALLQHLQERQRLMEERFPLRSFLP
ncbi:MAG TPA: hypothetical protein VJ600_11265 [Holophagaceae bacterium]|nr:hypothetical protein [Holophagaceae bacterium]